MVMRIRDKWKANQPRSIEAQATAMAYVIWQIALSYTKNLHQERFDFESDRQRTSVIGEYLIFLSHITDRYAFNTLNQQDREIYISTVVDQVARHYQRNCEQVLGVDNYRASFIDLANNQFDCYARCGFDGELPGYSARRFLGNRIQQIMGDSQTNKWIIQQIIDIDSLEAAEKLMQSTHNLMS